MNPIFTKMVDAVEAANAAPDDYINSADGLKYCGKCRTPKEAFYPADLQAQGFTKHPVMCKCAAERREREEAERRENERMSYMTMLRSEAFRDMPAAGWRFESAAVTTPQLAKVRGYAQNWDEFKKAGIKNSTKTLLRISRMSCITKIYHPEERHWMRSGERMNLLLNMVMGSRSSR